KHCDTRKPFSERVLPLGSLIGDPWIAPISSLVIKRQTSPCARSNSLLVFGTGFGVSRFLHPTPTAIREQNSRTKTFQRIKSHWGLITSVTRSANHSRCTNHDCSIRLVDR